MNSKRISVEHIIGQD